MLIKLKTRKAAFKRVKIKKKKLIRKRAYKSHLLAHKSSKKLRNLSSPAKIHDSNLSAFKLMLPYNCF